MGALALLSQASLILWCTRKWHRLQPLLLTLCASASQFSDDKIQIATQNLFSQLYQTVFALPLTVPSPEQVKAGCGEGKNPVSSISAAVQSAPSVNAAAAVSGGAKEFVLPAVTPQHIARRVQAVAGYSRSLRRQYNRLMSELLAIVNQVMRCHSHQTCFFA